MNQPVKSRLFSLTVVAETFAVDAAITSKCIAAMAAAVILLAVTIIGSNTFLNPDDSRNPTSPGK